MLTPEEHRDPSCGEHPHCVCGRQLDDDGSRELVCPECGTSVLIGAGVRQPMEVDR